MSKPLRLRTRLEPRGPAAAVVLSDEQVQSLGAPTKVPAVRVTINGHTIAGRVGRMRGENLIGLSKAARAECGVQPGDEVEVEIALEAGPREVEVPDALAAALNQDPEAKARFEALAYTHRKEFARWVAEAKREETRTRRVSETLRRLHASETLS